MGILNIMKKLLLTFIVIFTFTFVSHCQTLEGTYTNTWESNAGGALTYTLTLNPDKTFNFVSHRIYESSYPSKTTTVVGTWKNENRLLILATDTSLDDIDLVKGLNNNKARFITYSPRHRKYGEVKPSLRFYKSKVFYAKGMKLIKEEAEVKTNTAAVGS